jgi:hypothetical protein
MQKTILPQLAGGFATSGRNPHSVMIFVRVLAVMLAVLVWSGGRPCDAGATPDLFATLPPARVTPAGICGTAIALSDTRCKRDPSKNLEIGANGCGPSVYVDKDFVGDNQFNTITIDSGTTLCFPDATVKFDVGSILVNGLLQIGQKANPIGTADPNNLITLNFLGKRPCAEGTNCSTFSKGIQVQSGGSVQMFGLKGVPTKGLNATFLAKPAGPPKSYGKGNGVTVEVAADAAETLRVADDVSQGTGRWQAGDWIAVGSTSFNPYDTEIVKILKITSKPLDNPTGSNIFLSTPLVHYHFGSTAPTPSQLCTVSNVPTYFQCGKAPVECNSPCISQPSPLNYSDPDVQNYGVDERAPVALLSRNIKLTGIIASKDAANLHWGGETKILMGYKEVSIQGVELQKFGKDQLGSYPIHFHMDMDVSGAITLFDSNSIDHSYNKCVTIHTTQNLTISNINCVRAVGHLFYEELGDEKGITFQNNIGLGAMSNSFDINKTKISRDDLIKRYWWTGDYQTNGLRPADDIGYDGFNVPNMDATTNPTHGSCAQVSRSGGLFAYVPPPDKCPAGQYYTEAASGFWVVNPATRLIGNLVDGCQGVGVGYWYVPPPGLVGGVELPRQPIGTFLNNRVNACYHGLFAEQQFSDQISQLPHPQVGGVPSGRNLLAEFDGLTATRSRDRGVWMRDQWFVINHGRFATNRDSASLLTAGGIDGATPGDWMLTENSVFEGISRNNVDRFGPCPLPDTSFASQEPKTGCIDQTPPPNDETPHSGDELGKGYPDPSWNMFGYLIYDGPARLTHDRFVNFLRKPALTKTDDSALQKWATAHSLTDKDGKRVDWVYEGDAAFGWFQSNQSSYPTLANVAQLSFVNTDLRHQVYTQLVNLGKDPANPTSGFGDGDQNTAVVDLDGTLAGFDAADASNNVSKRFDGAHPISLNGLLINTSSNSVDECLSEGVQDTVLEKRPTALMSASSMATLELQMLFPHNDLPDKDTPPPHLQKQAITFTKDALDFSLHDTMTLTSRNALGVWEPKVTSGLSYTVTAAIDTNSKGTKAGIDKIISLGIVDAFKPDISSTNPFYVRMGICYGTANGKPASSSSFNITRGYHSYGGGTVGPNFVDPPLRSFYNQLVGMYTANANTQDCNNLVGNNLLDGKIPINLQFPATSQGKTFTGCPANGITLVSAGCPAGTTTGTDNFGQSVCVYPTDNLAAASTLSEITNLDGTFNSTADGNGRTGLDKYYYDVNTGWLFLYVAQQRPNALGPSPLANCKDAAVPDPSCPNNANGETYYVCPAEGCKDYVVSVTDNNYKPGVSTCPDPYAAGLGAPEPTPLFHLTLTGTTTPPVARNPISGAFPHYEASSATPPVCK